MVLLGTLLNVQNDQIKLATDLKENLAKADKFEANFLKGIDNYIDKNDLNIPPENLPQLNDGYELEVIEDLDLQSAGIGTVIWAVGYSFDFNLVKFPVFDDDGYPIQKRGTTCYPGLYFIGLPWLHKQKSGLLSGVGDDAAFIASTIAEREVSNCLA